MAGKLEGRVAIVTGASRGIGEAIALELAREGAIVAACSTKQEGSLPIADAVIAAGGKAKAYGVDVSDPTRVDEVVKSVIADFGRVDILVNNAGITRDMLLMRMTDEDWDRVIDVNLKGTFNFIRAVSRPMMKNKPNGSIPAGGAIVNITSVVGITGNAGQANYTASKGGVIALTKTVAKELGSRGVRCNAVAPGFIETQMTQSLPEEVKTKYMESVPLKRFGQPSDIAKAVSWLVSDDSSYVTGQILSVNGGMV